MKFRTLICLLGSSIILAACGSGNPPVGLPPVSPGGEGITETSGGTESGGAVTTPTQTPFEPEPSSTPIPLAMTIAGEMITMAEFEAAVLRYQAAHPSRSPEQASEQVQRDLISQVLLAQAASESGFVVDDALLEARLDTLAEQVGGPDALISRLGQQGYTESLFRLELRRAIAAAWMRDQITDEIPVSTEQVRARQIVVFSQQEAQSLINQLQTGSTFEVLVYYYDPVSLGEMGWFPRGYLLQPDVEAAAFSLEPGEYSGIIQTELGFHIIQVIEREADRELEPEARLSLQHQLLDSWLAEREAQTEIVILVP